MNNIRRIDDLGRVVIPKEMRRILGIKEGDPLEININSKTGRIIIEKYQPILEKDINNNKVAVYEDGYGDDGSPIYKCPKCYVDVYEHQEKCHKCRQILDWN